MLRFSNSTLHSGYAHHKPSRRRACPTSRIHRKCVAEHRVSAFGLLLSRLVLNDIPVLDQHAILDANDVCRDPVHRRAKAGESTVNYHEITFSHDYSRLILQRGRHAFDEIKEDVTTGLEMCAIVNVLGRPETQSRRVVTVIEQHVVGCKDNGFILL